MGKKLDLINELYAEISVFHRYMPWVSLHDITIDAFKEKHKCVLALDIESELKGHYIIAHYYNNVWNSRSESSIICEYLGIGYDYTTYYCQWNGYDAITAPQLKQLRDADREDRLREMRKNDTLVALAIAHEETFELMAQNPKQVKPVYYCGNCASEISSPKCDDMSLSGQRLLCPWCDTPLQYHYEVVNSSR